MELKSHLSSDLAGEISAGIPIRLEAGSEAHCYC
jgi:hypothetical protein